MNGNDASNKKSDIIIYTTEDGFKRVQDIMKNSKQLEEYVSYEKLVNNEYSIKEK